MANVWFCSDLHFGHKNIGKYRNLPSEEENRWRITKDWESCVTKRDIVYVLGDACFTPETLSDFGLLPGEKILVRGNHDKLTTQEYLQYFKGVYGLVKYKEFWLSHAPIHPIELRGKVNLHGHVHYGTLLDNRYLNCCPENLVPTFGKALVDLQTVREYLNENAKASS